MPKRIAIVGAEAAKFTQYGMAQAYSLITKILGEASTTELPILVSGGCHLGGIDIWAEHVALQLGLQKTIHYPETHSWERGYKPRNLLIAKDCDELHNIVVDKLPDTYVGMRFKHCYHCKAKGRPADNHVKSGGCWTANRAIDLGKPTLLHIVSNV